VEKSTLLKTFSFAAIAVLSVMFEITRIKGTKISLHAKYDTDAYSEVHFAVSFAILTVKVQAGKLFVITS